MIETLGVSLILIYVFGIFIITYYWKKIPISPSFVNTKKTYASILIPVRNEEKNLERLVRSILNNSVTNDCFEIIIIDDHSDDRTSEIATMLQSNERNVSSFELSRGLSGKKEAIRHGVSQAKGDLILCTDGDSSVSFHWIESHIQSFETGARLSFGSVEYMNSKNYIMTNLLNLELSALVAIGGASLQMQNPTMINGCNYSFSKSTFNEVGGFIGNEYLPTGDDEFLLRKIFNKYPQKIDFIRSNKAVVTTEQPKSLTEFVNQRRRWASKWKHHKDVFSNVTPVGLFVGYFFIIVMFSKIFIDFSPILLFALLTKLIVDWFFLWTVRRVYGRHVNLLSLIILQFIYPFYVVFFGIASNFGSYSWRERDYKI